MDLTLSRRVAAASLPALVSVLLSPGTQLLEVHWILCLWSAPDVVCRCGLYHSGYSNSYINLAIS